MRISDWSSDVCSSDLQNEKLIKFAEALEKANGQLQAATMWLMQTGMTNPNNAVTAAYSYMHIMGIVSVGLMWLRMARAAARMLAAGQGDGRFLEAQHIHTRYYENAEARCLGKEG